MKRYSSERLVIEYKIKKRQDDKLDKEIEAFAKKVGFPLFCGCGFDYVTKFRDFCFHKEVVKKGGK